MPMGMVYMYLLFFLSKTLSYRRRFPVVLFDFKGNAKTSIGE